MNYCILLFLYIIDIYYIFLIANIILSWVPFLYKFKIFRLIGFIGDLYLEPFQGVLVLGPIDFTPVLGFLLYSGFWAAINFLLP